MRRFRMMFTTHPEMYEVVNGFFILLRAEQGMGQYVMGQMGHENQIGHMGHGSLSVDP